MPGALVLAGNSFVGKHLGRALRAAGFDVTATARRPETFPGAVACDLTDRARVAAVVAAARPDAVFQCAGATHSTDAWATYRLHVEGTLNVLDAVARHAAAAPVIVLGSAAEYGPVAAALPVREDYPAAPRNLFGASKLAQTDAARAAAAEWGLAVIVARPFNIIGPGLPGHYFAAAFAGRLRQARAAGGTPGDMPVTNADATRDFVDVRDVADALVGLATRAAPARGTMTLYNVASGRETSVLAVAAKLCALAGGFRAVPAGSGRSRSDIDRSCGDPSRLREAIGWSPRIGWEQSIKDYWHESA